MIMRRRFILVRRVTNAVWVGLVAGGMQPHEARQVSDASSQLISYSNFVELKHRPNLYNKIIIFIILIIINYIFII